MICVFDLNQIFSDFNLQNQNPYFGTPGHFTKEEFVNKS